MAEKLDFTGKKFNMITVNKRISNYQNTGKTYYECKCNCGNILFINTTSIRKETTFSCGCVKKKIPAPNRKNRVGEKYNKLTIIKMLYGYKDKQTYCECLCDCGNTTIVYCGNVVSGKTQSCGCYEKSSRYTRKHTENLLGQRFGKLVVIKETDKRYSNGGVGWLCKCDCGNEIVVRASNLKRWHTCSCGCSKTSKLEECVKDYFEENNIEYIREHRFKDCKNIHTLPFDFYIPKDNICIECQGEQHYCSVKHFGGEERFKTTQNNDRIKAEYCANNNIKLITLPYYLKKEEFYKELTNIFNPVTTIDI